MIDRAVVRFRRAVTHFFPGQCEFENRVLGVGVWWGYGWMDGIWKSLSISSYVSRGLFVQRVKRVERVKRDGLCFLVDRKSKFLCQF